MLAVTAVIAVGGRDSRACRPTTLPTREADTRFREATTLRLSREAQSMLAGIRSGGDVRAFQQILAARRTRANRR